MAEDSLGNIVLPEQLQDELEKLFAEYTQDINRGMTEAVTTTMKELVADTKAARSSHIGLRNGKFFDYIASKSLRNPKIKYGRIFAIDVAQLWYVKPPEYRLAHLLNNGHGGKSPYGGDPFITRAHDKAIANYERRAREVIERAGN